LGLELELIKSYVKYQVEEEKKNGSIQETVYPLIDVFKSTAYGGG
jgi:hypothetical protein